MYLITGSYKCESPPDLNNLPYPRPIFPLNNQDVKIPNRAGSAAITVRSYHVLPVKRVTFCKVTNLRFLKFIPAFRPSSHTDVGESDKSLSGILWNLNCLVVKILCYQRLQKVVIKYNYTNVIEYISKKTIVIPVLFCVTLLIFKKNEINPVADETKNYIGLPDIEI